MSILPDNVIFTNNIASCSVLSELISGQKSFILVDQNTREYCLPLLADFDLKKLTIIEISSGEEYKNINTLQYIIEALGKNGADRKSLFINLGGGVISDMGGLAASLFKRGVRFVNIPTTLLAQVDASCGGKLAIDFNGLKNEIGLFNNPYKVFISPEFLKTLPVEQLTSGLAEAVKHSLILKPDYFNDILMFNPVNPDYELLGQLVKTSVEVKNFFVSKDPFEHDIRKMLNFGHTIGHAIESFSFTQNTPLLHGHAVAAGMVCELWLSCKYLNFPEFEMIEAVGFIKKYYAHFWFSSYDFDALYSLMLHDKKNDNGTINFSLLEAPGKFKINCVCSKEDIFNSLNFYINL